MNLFKTITMLFYPAAKRSCCHRNFELKIEFLDWKPMEIKKMDKYSFLHKSLITQSVACSNDGIIFVYYMHNLDNLMILFIMRNIDIFIMTKDTFLSNPISIFMKCRWLEVNLIRNYTSSDIAWSLRCINAWFYVLPHSWNTSTVFEGGIYMD